MAQEWTLSEEAWNAALSRLGEECGASDGGSDTLREAVSAAARVSVRELQAVVEDVAIREAIKHGWCEYIEDDVLSKIFPDGPLDGDKFRDSDGRDRRGEAWRDSDGYDRQGLDSDGFSRDGYNSDGVDRYGFNRDNMDIHGVHRDDPARYVYNTDGVGLDGFYANGSIYRYLTRDLLKSWQADPSEFKYDATGRDVDGRDPLGYDRDGYDLRGFDRNGRDRDRYDLRGFDRSGNRRDGRRYDAHGFDQWGYWQGNDLYDPDGFSAGGTHRRTGLTREATAERKATERLAESAVIPG